MGRSVFPGNQAAAQWQGTGVRNIGRFIIVDLLGSGTQGKVYRCSDPKLEREVAIKLLHRPLLGGARANDELMREARSLSRLNHQNLVSVFDVGELKGRPYVVFELIEGPTIAELLKKEHLDVSRVLQLLDGILNGISAAHAQDIVHRDIKPANIILNPDGVPKITDFGIAAALRGEVEDQGSLVGTPGYMAPEYIGQGRLMKQSDVFALGLLAWELLVGRPAYQGANAERLRHAIVNRPVQPLDQVLPDIDERLRKIVEKALEKDPYLRFADAGEMRQALLEYRNVAQQGEVALHSHSTVQFLLRRIRLKRDFPAFSQTISTLNQLSASSSRDASQLAAIIVKDQGLSSKILRVVNSAYYAAFSGNISTVSRALVVLGMNGVCSIAASLSLLEHFGSQSHLKELLSESLYSGLCAREICKEVDPRLGEEALLGAMLRRLGHVLVAYYLPDEEQEIRRQCCEVEGVVAKRAEISVLGADYAHIGREVAAEWNFPTEIRGCMRDVTQLPKACVLTSSQRLQMVACLADEATTVLRQKRSAESVQRLRRLVASYSRVLGVEPMKIVDSIATAKREYLQFKVNFVTPKEKQHFVDSLEGDMPAQGGGGGRDTAIPQRQETLIVHPGVRQAEDRKTLLEQGLETLSRRIADGGNPEELTGLVLDVLYQAMGFKRIIAAESDEGGKYIVAASGRGDDVDELLRSFRVPCAGKSNLLSIATRNNGDIYIQDATQASIRDRMPPWFSRTPAPGSFLVLPMHSGNRAAGLLYAEYRLAYGLDQDPQVLRLVQALRDRLLLGTNQVAMAQ